MLVNFRFYVLIVLTTITYVSSNRVFEKIYEPLQGDLACFKRFNGTHEIGCSSGFWGNVGVLHVVDSDQSFEWFLRKAPHPYYILAFLPKFFTKEILNSAWNSGKLTGALFINSKNYSTMAYFSSDHVCPNSESSLYKDTSYSNYCSSNPWNPYGTSLMYMNWPFPIFYINNETSIENILNCYNTFNKPLNDEPREWPLCAIELQSSMFGTINSEVCIRRGQSLLSSFDSTFCEPLEDINVWSSSYPLNKTTFIEEKSVIIIAAASDASSMFDNISPGAESAVTGLVTLLATAEALYKYIKDFDTSKNIIFVIYEGESWDYIGSSRMVYDMSNGQFPYKLIEDQEDQMNQLNLTHIDAVIDLKQLGFITDGGRRTLYVHTDPISSSDETIFLRNDDYFTNLKNEAINWNLDIKRTDTDAPLPPSSLQSFLKKYNISGFVLTDHENQYKNAYYESVYDDSAYVNFKYGEDTTDENDQLHKDLADIASSLASTLYYILTERHEKVEANSTIVNNLLYCYLKNTNCTFFQKHSDDKLIKLLYPKPAKMYVSVKRAEHHLSYITARMLAYFMGSEVELNETMCKSNNTQISTLQYFPFIDNGTCIESYLHSSKALSPAFKIENYDWKSGEYSSWTESTWQLTKAQLFLKPSQVEEISLLIGGVFSLIISVTIVYILDSRAGLIFLSEIPPTPC